MYDFGVRIIHQLDPEVNKALNVSGVLSRDLPTGKGAELWLGVGLSSGDVVCFVDGDIRDFQGWQIAALLKPILDSWRRAENSILYSKAYYTRLAVNLDTPEKGFYKLGSRVTRLFVIPLIRTLSKRGALVGLEKLRYPLSGEFAGARNPLESIEFPAGYDAETGVLIEMWRRGLLRRIEQVDLTLFQHFPQSDSGIQQMVSQIARLVVTELSGEVSFDQKLVDDYVSEAIKEMSLTSQMYERAEIRIEVEHEVKRDFFRDAEGDRKKALAYAEELRRAADQPQKMPIQRLPSWESIRRHEKGERLLSLLRRRGTAYTMELLGKQGLVSL